MKHETKEQSHFILKEASPSRTCSCAKFSPSYSLKRFTVVYRRLATYWMLFLLLLTSKF